MSALHLVAALLSVPLEVERDGAACRLREISINEDSEVTCAYHAPARVVAAKAEFDVGKLETGLPSLPADMPAALKELLETIANGDFKDDDDQQVH